MNITKYEHACFVVEKDGQRLLVDPGNFTDDFRLPEDLMAVVLTHLHPDHCDVHKLARIREHYPNIPFFAHQSVAKEYRGTTFEIVEPGDIKQAGGFTLEFNGGEHATIHPDIPPIANLSVTIDGILYYPGDSFAVPPKQMQIIAVPASAPWLKISEAMDFITKTRPAYAFPTHDAILSGKGKQLVDRLLGIAAAQVNTTYERIKSGETVEF